MTIKEIFERQREFVRQTYPIYEQEVKLHRIDNLESEVQAEIDALRNRVECAIDKLRDGVTLGESPSIKSVISRLETALWGAIPPVCEWTEYDSEYPGTYKTACGDLFSFTEGGIAENGAKYCHYCGKPIKPTEKP